MAGVSGSSYDYGARIYNPRIGKFLSVDPISGSFPNLSPYQYAMNNPIVAIDVMGYWGDLSTGPPSVKPVINPVSEKLTKELAKEAAKNVGGKSLLEAAPKVSSGGLALFSVPNLIIAVSPLLMSGHTERTPDEIYEQTQKMKPEGAEQPVTIADAEENPRYDNAMKTEGYFVGTPAVSTDTKENNQDKEYYIHYTNRKGFTGIAGTGVLFPNKRGKVYLQKRF